MPTFGLDEPNDPRPMLQPHEISHAPEYAYSLTRAEADELSVLLVLPPEERTKRVAEFSPESAKQMLVQFLTMAKSVEANTRSFVEQFLLIQCNFTERASKRINLPSLAGALHGATMACKPNSSMCAGCAFRQGTMANQSIITSTDAADAVASPTRFMCHEHCDEDGEPLKVCAGYASKRAALQRSVRKKRS